MDFLNIGGGELLVIVLLALILFRPEDIYKAMRTLGRYTRSARRMWNEFSTNIKQEMDTREVEAAAAETKALLKSAEEAVATLKTSVNDVTKTLEGDVAAAGKSLKSQATESAAALKAEPVSVTTAELSGATAALKEGEDAIDTVEDTIGSAADVVNFERSGVGSEVNNLDSAAEVADPLQDEPMDEVSVL